MVYGLEITQQQIDAFVARMKLRHFTASTLALAAYEAGAKRFNGYNEVSSRAADRLIQRERKAGNLVRLDRGWIWSPERLEHSSASAPQD